MVSQGAPSRSIVAMAEPSSVAKALPTPCRRKDQATSVTLVPLRVVGGPQAHVFVFHLRCGPLAAQLEHRTLEAREVAFAPGGGGDAQLTAVQVDHPPVARIVEQQIVGVEVGVVEA